MKYDILKEIISLAEDFEEQTNARERRKEQFISWLLQSSKENLESKRYEKVPAQDGMIAMFIAFMYRYAQFYSRRLFRDTPIYSFDDFGVLASLYPGRSLRKVDILKQVILEKSSGNEVLKRLLREELLEEKENPKDARSKLISLSEKGTKAFEDIRFGINKLSKHVTGDLSEDEKSSLLSMLFRLHDFHKPYFEDAREEEIEEILGIV